ncbi:coiled-coil-helix-coiled-coil-helix domain-containing protein 5-like [Asterias amurensis]|uniref:coiled-coil-helix-coiled-coil-helix domain-containing protein 5-like n=1 Tax=Asterias amurensis TaxID=7602 RepID=UPI003AB14A21
MDAVLTLVMKYCGKELDTYGNCVKDHPDDWQTACDELKVKASNCSDHHPVVRQINRDCASEFHEYEFCLKKNQTDVTQCVEKLQSFLKCADVSAHRIQNAVVEKESNTESASS